MSDTKTRGVVKFFKEENGYGFIYPDSEMQKANEKDRKNVFFHATNCIMENDKPPKIHPGDEVEYELSESTHASRTEDNAYHAVNVRVLKRAKTHRKHNPDVPRVTVGLLKKHVPILTAWVKVFAGSEDAQQAAQMTPEEIEAVKEFHNILTNIGNHIAVEHKVESAPAKSSKKKNDASAEATAA